MISLSISFWEWEWSPGNEQEARPKTQPVYCAEELLWVVWTIFPVWKRPPKWKAVWEGEQKQGYSAFPRAIIRTGGVSWCSILGWIAACLFTTFLSILCTLGLVQVPVVHTTGDSWVTAQPILLDWINELLSQSFHNTLVLLTRTTVWWRWECYCSGGPAIYCSELYQRQWAMSPWDLPEAFVLKNGILSVFI